MNKMLAVAGLVLALALGGCAGSGDSVAIPDDGVREKLIYSSSAERPAWTMEEPDTEDGVMSFVGVSKRFATEQGAREDARRNALDAVVKWMGTLVKNKFESLSVSFGLDSTVIDPTQSTKDYEKQLAANMASRVKVKTWYMEKWQTETGLGYQVFALAQMPTTAADETLKDMAKGKAKEAEKQAREAADDQAKAQAQKAAEFWKQMQDQGVVD
ncbi:MAG: hypothetical protein KJ950_14340 [Proteobacteria bacterium]|nr:hypothetical protein [Pseudomonadota bacterium]MBU1687898.1 hypothetical protein [Pseudomonadota bacterium]